MRTKLFICLLLAGSLIQLLQAVDADLYDLRGTRVARIEVFERVELPMVVSSLAAARQLGAFPSYLPHGYYIVAQAAAAFLFEEGYRDPSVFVDLTDSHLPAGEYGCGRVAVADFDGNGLDDIFFTIGQGFAPAEFQPRIWMQQPNGQFLDETTTRLPSLTQPSNQVLAFDYDHDLDQDLLIIELDLDNDHITNTLLTNDGNGVFSMAPPTVMPGAYVYWACVVEANGDAYPDLLFTEIDLSLERLIYRLWINNGGQSFAPDTAGRLPEAAISAYGHFRAFALDQTSSYQDLILSNTTETDEYGNIIRSGQDLYLLNNNGYYSLPTLNPLPTDELFSTYYRSLDHDLDGDNDLLRSNIEFDGYTNLEILLYDPSVSSYVPNTGNLPHSDWIHNGLLVWDFDLDGDPDIFAPRVDLGQEMTDWYLENNGSGSYSLANTALPDILDFTVDCALINCNNDIRMDLVIGNAGTSVQGTGRNRLYLNTDGSSADNPVPPVQLVRAHPNPFSGTCTISFSRSGPPSSPVSIYNSRGQLVRRIPPLALSQNTVTAVWDGTDEQGIKQAAGIYLFRVSSGSGWLSGKLLFLH